MDTINAYKTARLVLHMQDQEEADKIVAAYERGHADIADIYELEKIMEKYNIYVIKNHGNN